MAKGIPYTRTEHLDLKQGANIAAGEKEDGAKVVPAAELSAACEVILRTPGEQLISRPGRKAIDAACGEKIMHERLAAETALTAAKPTFIG